MLVKSHCHSNRIFESDIWVICPLHVYQNSSILLRLYPIILSSHVCVFSNQNVCVYYIYIHIISAWYPDVHSFTLICVCFISLPAPKSENFLGGKNTIPRIIIPTYPLWAKHTWLYSNSWYPQIWLVIVELYSVIFEDITNHLTINMLSPDMYIYIYIA